MRRVAQVPVRSGDEVLGAVTLYDADAAHDPHEVLELAAVAALTAVTLRDASVTRRRATATLFDDLQTPLGQAQLALGLQALEIERAASELSAR